MDIKLLTASAIMPTRATENSAGLDLYADMTEPKALAVGEIFMVSTGVAIALPQDTVGLVFGRSGLGIKHGIAPANGVGVIDSDYRGELKVGLINHGSEAYTINPGDRIAQLVVVPILAPKLCAVEELSETERGMGGFGHSGKK